MFFQYGFVAWLLSTSVGLLLSFLRYALLTYFKIKFFFCQLFLKSNQDVVFKYLLISFS